ncbi:MAG TPA: prenyltransferase/squalene oxidase repeat-containing protein [Thermoleophilaceae bacterium]|jgi:energy-coupling factor transport system substrate-specific component
MSWQLSSFLVLVLALAAGFLWYERQKPPARVLSLVAALAALAVVGRLAFAAFPNVKPTTDIVLFAGYALGAAPGFAVGAVTALVSNVFLSQGPWTVWQMAGWGGVGVGGALLARMARGRELGRVQLAIVCGLAGFAFGAWMDVYQWTLAARQDLDSYLAVSASSFPYNLAHAIGNVVFCLIIGPVFVRALRRYRRRFEVRWRPAPAAAAALVALAVASGLAAPPSADASSTSRAASYLLRAQNRDGGFGGAPRSSSSQLMTGWAALGLAAGRHNARDVHRRHGKAISTYLRRHAGGIRDIGEIERTVLVLRASALSVRRFGGRDLVAEILGKRRSDGSIAGYVSYTAFGILALKAARKSVGSSTIAWLERSQRPDGGFGLTPGSGADFDMTGATLQALAAVGHGHGSAAHDAVIYLRKGQNPDGGFPQMSGGTSNAQSTAYAVQGLVAVHAGADMVASALRYIKRLQRRNGSVRYSSVSSQTPVWVTAQALMALKKKPLPLKPVKRKHKRKRASHSSAAAAATTTKHQERAKHEAASAPAETHRAAEPGDAPTATVATKRTSAGAGRSKDDGPSAWLVAGVAVVALAAILGLRVFLRRRRATNAPAP